MKNPDLEICKGMPTFEQLPNSPTAFILIQFDSVNAFNVRLSGYFTCRVYLDDKRAYEDKDILSGSTVPNIVGKRLKTQAEQTN